MYELNLRRNINHLYPSKLKYSLHWNCYHRFSSLDPEVYPCTLCTINKNHNSNLAARQYLITILHTTFINKPNYNIHSPMTVNEGTMLCSSSQRRKYFPKFKTIWYSPPFSINKVQFSHAGVVGIKNLCVSNIRLTSAAHKLCCDLFGVGQDELVVKQSISICVFFLLVLLLVPQASFCFPLAPLFLGLVFAHLLWMSQDVHLLAQPSDASWCFWCLLLIKWKTDIISLVNQVTYYRISSNKCHSVYLLWCLFEGGVY